MSKTSRTLCTAVAALLASPALPAHADLSIAKRTTKNVSCTGGSCVATARDAVMNAGDLEALLAAQPTVSLDAGLATNIAVDAALTWTSNATLSLTARHTLTVNKPVSVAGSGGVAIQTADGGLSFAPKASLSFWSLSSPLTINGAAYTLVGDIKSMNFEVSTPVALARDYDASADGAYTYVPIQFVQSAARLEGLGHTISHLTMEGHGYPASGFVGENDGVLSNLRLEGDLSGGDKTAFAVGSNIGLIEHVAVKVAVISNGGLEAAGLAAENTGVIRDSSARVNIRLGGGEYTGGLVGINSGLIDGSWAEGTVRGSTLPAQLVGGLVALNGGAIRNSYTIAYTGLPRGDIWDIAHGGLIGQTSTAADYPSSVSASYAAGATAPRRVPPFSSNDGLGIYGGFGFAGSVVGFDGSSSTFQSTYWATDSSRHNPKAAAGNKAQLAGASGVTEAALKSGLPAGFDPTIWGQSATINSGYPYLLANPPQ